MPNVYGFNGQLTQERISQWSRLQSGLDFTASTASDWAPRPVSGLDRVVGIGAGVGLGYGITIDSPGENVTLDTVASGVRHDLIAWKLTWKSDGTGGAGELVAVPGTSVQAMPQLAMDPGVGTAYVPICLARVQAGIQLPVIVEDYRVWGSQDLYAYSLASVLNPRHGQKVTLIGDGTTYRYNTSRWERVYRPNLWWAGFASSGDGSAVNGRYVFPHWATTNAFGTSNLAVNVNQSRLTLPAGAYVVQPWANTVDRNALAKVSVNATGSLTTIMDSAPATVHLNLPNGASGPLNLPNPTEIIVGFSMSGNFTQQSTSVKILRVGDL